MHVSIADTDIVIETERVTGNVEPRIQQYLQGEHILFDCDIDLSDLTAFQQDVLDAIRTVSYGKTVTYGELAVRIGRPDAVRAVANACGVNPVPIVIPCHRVVGKTGAGGYRYGKDVKQELLALEQR